MVETPFFSGPIAQVVELPAHNRLVPGSSPGGPSYLTEMDIYQYKGRYKERELKIEERSFNKRAAHKKAALFVLNKGGAGD